jgi:hypothetical protein
MKRLLEKDKEIRYYYLNNHEKKHLILKLIFKNFNFFTLVRWYAIFYGAFLAKNNLRTKMINRCLFTYNKKRFSKLSAFSRHIFLKLIRKGTVLNIQK